MSKGHIGGGKVTGNHTTLIPLAKPIVIHLQDDPHTTSIVLGRIEQRSGRSSTKKAKLVDETGCLVIEVTANRTVQTIRVYTNGMHETKLSLARFVRAEGYELRFHNRIPT